MKKIYGFSLGFLFLISPLTFAASLHPELSYYTKEFYVQVKSGVEEDELREDLFEILSSGHIPNESSGFDDLVSQCRKNSDCYEQKVLGYDEARRQMFGRIDLKGEEDQYFVRCVYCQKDYDKNDFPRGQGPAPGRIPSSMIMNTEHTWPQSRFSRRFDKAMQKSDLHILFPSDMQANSLRSNLQLADVGTTLKQSCEASRMGYAQTNINSHELFFEPPVNTKGMPLELCFILQFATNLISAKSKKKVFDVGTPQTPSMKMSAPATKRYLRSRRSAILSSIILNLWT